MPLVAQVTQKLTGLTRTRRDQLLEEYCRGIQTGDPDSGQPFHAMRVRVLVNRPFWRWPAVHLNLAWVVVALRADRSDDAC